VNGQLESLKDLNIADPRYFINAFHWDKFALMKTPVDNIFNWNNQNKRPSRFRDIHANENAERYAVFYRWPLPQQTVRLSVNMNDLGYDAKNIFIDPQQNS
jgi:hypothetical protein